MQQAKRQPGDTAFSLQKGSEFVDSDSRQVGDKERYAGFWIRLVAILIDALMFAVAITLLILVNVTFRSIALHLVMFFLAVIVGIGFFAYTTLMVYKYGATLGKMVMKIRVCRTDFQTVDIGTAALRETFGKYLSVQIFGLGFIWVAFDPRKRALHDHIAKTIVVHAKKNEHMKWQ